jgi:hypothetical protein
VVELFPLKSGCLFGCSLFTDGFTNEFDELFSDVFVDKLPFLLTIISDNLLYDFYPNNDDVLSVNKLTNKQPFLKFYIVQN